MHIHFAELNMNTVYKWTWWGLCMGRVKLGRVGKVNILTLTAYLNWKIMQGQGYYTQGRRHGIHATFVRGCA